MRRDDWLTHKNPTWLFPALGHGRRYGHTATDFPHALRISKASIALPVGPHLTDDDMRFIAASVREGSERLLG